MTTQTQVRPTWDVRKIQEAATMLVAHKIASRIQVIERCAGNEVEKMEKSSALLKAQMLKDCGVKTPMDLVNHLAEFEANMFNSQVSIGGTDKNAFIVNERPTVWLEAKRIANFSKEQESRMQQHYKEWMEYLAEALGFQATVEIAPDGNRSKITFFKN